MKKAMLVSGHIRTFEKTLKNIKEFIPDIDVYAYIVKTDGAENVLSKLEIENYKLVDDESIDLQDFSKCDERYIFPKVDSNGRPTFKSVEAWLRQLNDYKRSYTWFKSLNTSYDLVFRYRTDLIIKKLDMDLNLNKDVFNCFQQNHYRHQINDKVFVSRPDIMEQIMCGCLDALRDNRIDSVRKTKFNTEQFLYSHVKKLNLEINFIDTADFYIEKIKDDREVSAGFLDRSNRWKVFSLLCESYVIQPMAAFYRLFISKFLKLKRF